MAPFSSAQAPLKASTWPLVQTRAAGSPSASSISTQTSPVGLRTSLRRNAKRPITATATAVKIKIRPGAL